jgi:hypothetical protein
MEVQRLIVLKHLASRSSEGSSVDLELLSIPDDSSESSGQKHQGVLSDVMSWGMMVIQGSVHNETRGIWVIKGANTNQTLHQYVGNVL